MIISAVFMACGTEDMLLAPNRAMHQFLVEQGVDVVYHEGPHNFDFWNQWLEPGICRILGVEKI